ncbi:IS1182 family transposase [Candidatus Endoriftia persephonae]|jgi:transposase/C4-type Zn-finger protein|uniref:Transposase, IS4 family n=2 Tax=Gammaproteobacteria TaxID=1236 RepID=G2FJZ7_9GAMM|nr:IS1182 family transposase [Candidatus Endoriftia persephone]EGW52878.1 transposase, IS4 family [endosymbiont of Tevnia jerichonana (vent Tica)]USF86363.1 IS1182 family transposase [Candidatus Endoriftia persephone]USF86378.1 IS1182 family transposase [Candidatus Endoriftia persephone]
MARYKDYNYDQMKMIPVSFERQILPGSFEYSLAYLIDNELDLSAFDQYYCNDENGRPAYDPRVLLKIIILAYSKGITSSRRIERLCRENIIFMALSADLQPDHSTLADFVSRSPEAVADLFSQIVLMCDQLGLIGKEMFAIDGCKLPSNASKEWSGTHTELKKKRQKIDRAVRRMLQRHCEQDSAEQSPGIQRHDEAEQIKKLRAVSRKIKRFLDTEPERTGVSGREVKSNITDNESAKIKTSHGVIQGYTGVAAVDSKNQVVIYAEAFWQGQEHGLLKPVIEGIRDTFNDSKSKSTLKKTKITADSGYHNREMLEYLEAEGVDAYIADTGFRSRDPRFKDHKEPRERNRRKDKERFTRSEFIIDRKKRTCRCPAGHALWLKAKRARIGHHLFMQFQAYEKDCNNCGLRKRCLRNEQQHTPRQINVALDITQEQKAGVIERMKRKIDSPEGRHIYSQRLGTVEPVFGHITDAVGIKRFSLRSKRKVDGQWKLMMMLHNILKIHRYGWEWA